MELLQQCNTSPQILLAANLTSFRLPYAMPTFPVVSSRFHPLLGELRARTQSQWAWVKRLVSPEGLLTFPIATNPDGRWETEAGLPPNRLRKS